MATKKPYTILQGTPLEKKIYLENPVKPTENDLTYIKRLYGIPMQFNMEQTVEALNKLSTATQKPTITQGTPQFNPKQYAEDQAFKIAEVENRMKLNEDPLKYLYNASKEKLDFSTGKVGDVLQKIPGVGMLVPDEIKIGSYLPKDLVSQPTFEAIGGVAGLYATKLLEGAPVAFKKSLAKKFPYLNGLFEVVGSTEKKIPTKGFTKDTTTYLGAEFLGSQAGASTYDFLNEMTRYFMDLPETSLKDQTNKFLYDSYMNLLFTQGSASLAPVFNVFKKPLQAMFGITPNAESFKKMKDMGETYGYPLSIIQMTNSNFIKGYAKVIGVFPWVGTPFRKAGEATDEVTRSYFKRINELMPVNTISELGADIKKMADKKYDSIRFAQNYLFDDFEEFAGKLAGKKVINLKNTKIQATRTYNKYLEGVPQGAYGKFQWPGSKSQEAFGKFYNELSNIDDAVTLDQAITLRQMFNDFMVNFKNELGGTIPRKEGAALGKLQDMFERDFGNLQKLDDDIDDAILQTAMKKYNTAVEFFADTAKNYDGGIVADFKQMNRSMFGPGAEVPGYMYAGEAFNTIFSRAKKDPEAMKHLLSLTEPTSAELKAYKMAGNKNGVTKEVETLVKETDANDPTKEIYVKKKVPIVSRGPDSNREIIMKRMFDDAIYEAIGGLPPGKNFMDFLSVQKADPNSVLKKGYAKVSPELLDYQGVTINANKFAKALGLDHPDGIQVLETVLKGTGTTVDSIKKFLSVADKAGSFVIPDPSTFVQRRVTLSGMKGLLLGGAGYAAGTIAFANFPMLVVPLLLRHGSNLLTDPAALEALTGTLETGVLTAARRKSLLQWAEKFLPDDEEAAKLDQQERIDEAVFSLMTNPSTNIEQSQAIPEGYQKSLNIKRPLNEQESMINKKLMDLQDAQQGASLQPRFNDMSLGPNYASLKNPNVRNALAFGTLDEALAAKANQGGIGAMG